MDALKSLVQPLVGGMASSSMVDGMKLVVLGGTVETARRVSSSAWSHFVNSFFLTASFSDEDMPYEWLMLWLSRRPEWQRSREFETTTRTTTVGLSARTNGGTELEDDEPDDPEDELTPGKQKLKVVFQPTFDSTHTIYYKGHWLRVRRTKKNDGVEVLSISVVARSNSVLKQLVLEAKKDYEAEAIHRVQIYFADSHGSWRWTDSRHKRPMSSIVLNPGVKEVLLNDARDFLRSEKWYADRGIPFRRGYLLHGVPGSGKTSLIHALAGELMLDIYVVSLSASWINDSTLTTLMGRVPARCILLLEDLDAAFTRSVTRDAGSTGAPTANNKDAANGTSSSNRSNSNDQGNQLSDTNTLSLSGLLNSLDGVAAAEGRILFATTNHLERLDPALSRPGRLDVWVEFKNASKWQAELLFRNFFPSAESEEMVLTPEEVQAIEAGLSTPPSPVQSSSSLSGMSESDTAFAPPPPTLEHAIQAPLTASRLAELAKKFAESIPNEEFSVAALQGYLLKNKTRPEAAAFEAAEWVISEREMRERLKREKEERDRKERLDKERATETTSEPSETTDAQSTPAESVADGWEKASAGDAKET
ncbi:P-loop containing nucleoside triphosphate hydrolase protein [Sistotremastrum niveocremeum HHB9708]|uniref:p-loop containing nucleoside triphosphate hydrolase protein n=1 Tax=Sistotremastrum niveocremeum HHB9708 TaxID=1314777 RepID=A0A165A977_9AGAM|nr:P-loop containing nucleoside triphosphate hydrolase protein [Sistotremastrum niveocremeum HHB9708]